jgi:parallel beta-helix repeat protein
MMSNTWGIIIEDATNIEIKSNEIHGNFIGIALISSFENEVSGNKLYAQDAEAIRMLGCEDNTISSNDLRNNFRGMYMISSSFNLITSNNFTNCGLSGIDFNRCSHDNHVYHNNFVTDRTEPDFEGYAIADDDEIDQNHWDDGYPSGGNYWDDYTGVDLYSGENQDVPGSDGIGDTPYSVLNWDEISRDFFFAEYNVDRYPLTDPWSPEDG